MRILITGSESSLPQLVIPQLLMRGHEVIGVDTSGRFGGLTRERNYDFVEGSLSHPSTLERLFKDTSYDAIYHFGALVDSVYEFQCKRPANLIAEVTSAMGTLLKSCCGNTKKFIHISSSMVYERCKNSPLREPDAAATPPTHTTFGIAMYFCEQLVHFFHEQYGLKYVIWRPFDIVPPFATPEDEGFNLELVEMVTKVLVEQQTPVAILGDGEQTRCFTSPFDIAEALSQFSFEPKAENQVFNVGQPANPLTVKQLCKHLVRIGKDVGVLPQHYELHFRSTPIRGEEPHAYLPDISKLKNSFSWTPMVPALQSIEQYIQRRLEAHKRPPSITDAPTSSIKRKTGT